MKRIVIALMAAIAIPFCAMAQDKFGHINSQEILQIMPERQAAESQLDTLASQYENEMSKMTEEYYSKIQDYQKNESTMTDPIKQARQSELAEMEQRIQNFRTQASQEIQKQQSVLFSPIVQKVQNAIVSVGDKNGFTYIFDTASQAIVYQSAKAIDVTSLVKAELGLK
ncbi:MAG: OmpH family outer membrane protein [Paludibacteraceae bacterium]|nr:OmpH family outer membrane protein [Paludibacteraceae bacterium]